MRLTGDRSIDLAAAKRTGRRNCLLAKIVNFTTVGHQNLQGAKHTVTPITIGFRRHRNTMPRRSNNYAEPTCELHVEYSVLLYTDIAHLSSVRH